jgi:heterodisulfide reductase subunit A
LRPVDTGVDGVLIAGTAAGPKDIPDAVAQAKAAASGAASLMAPGVYVVEPYYATVDDTICGGCGTCVLLCPFRAVSIEDKRAKINEALCKGCGVCAAACPAGAIKTNHFTDEQVMSQIEQAVAK